ncbi:MAG: RNA polymerase sigma factor [Bacteroidales bacterium]|nr:RNA polymerase sigma factor [Bacteroidales bacterium]
MKTDNADFRNLVREHSQRLYAHIRSILLNHHDTDDVLQNTFVKAWSGIHEFRAESEISTWLFRIATNEALQHLRKQKLRKLFFMGSDTEISDDVVQSDAPDGEAIQRKLEQAMKTLSVQQRMVFSMKYFNELKYTEIAGILQLKEGSLKAVYHNAVKKIEKYITENE